LRRFTWFRLELLASPFAIMETAGKRR
jgi:hypothetical protein